LTSRKCLDGGFERIAVISSSARRLDQLKEAMRGCFEDNDFGRLSFHAPENFIDALPALAPPTSAGSDGAPVSTNFGERQSSRSSVSSGA
jgi:hypothetical protein